MVKLSSSRNEETALLGVLMYILISFPEAVDNSDYVLFGNESATRWRLDGVNDVSFTSHRS